MNAVRRQGMTGLLHGRLADLRAGLHTCPDRRAIRIGLAALAIHLILTGFIGFGSRFMHLAPLQAPVWLAALLPVTLLVFPSLLEELFFRGVLIPHPSRAVSMRDRYTMVALSTVAFVLWHPLNALTINTTAAGLFTDMRFLAIVVVLGIACGIAYAETGVIWIPVAIHWISVLLWVFFFGGRNELLRVLR
ncbi:MAG: CPBP family intramembrane metalloprotease [Chitinivibrionales bacterium]|nr:CPBP family intramembrane metalloprotease [Chitinivibrionales bacterium]